MISKRVASEESFDVIFLPFSILCESSGDARICSSFVSEDLDKAVNFLHNSFATRSSLRAGLSNILIISFHVRSLYSLRFVRISISC